MVTGGVIREATLQQWRLVPDIGIFQALGFDWCNVIAGDGAYFERIAPGPHVSHQPDAGAGRPSELSVHQLIVSAQAGPGRLRFWTHG